MKLSEGQEKAYSQLNSPLRPNVFLTGVAGSGKSTVLLKYLRSIPKVVRLASTGAAAVLIEGRTFHSFFGLGVMAGPDQKIINSAIDSYKVKQNLKYTSDTIVIDEVSMLDSRALSLADQIAKIVRGKKDRPWGGLRVIACGDFAQLPPISNYGAPRLWAFDSKIWKDTNFQPCLLTEIMRMRDQEFLEVLNSVRIGEVTEEVRDFLNAHRGNKGIEARVFPRREQADDYNRKKLAELKEGEVVTSKTQFSGNEKFFGSLGKNMPIPEDLIFKKGALVMIRKNDWVNNMYVNGTLGTVIGYDPYSGVQIKLTGSEDYIWLEKSEFNWHDGGGEVVARAINYPMTLAYGNTIHKVQGATMTQLAADINNVWEPGQAYVALSRVRSANDLGIMDWNSQGIKADKKVREFYDGLK